MVKNCCQISQELIHKISYENDRLNQLDQKKSYIVQKNDILEKRLESMNIEENQYGALFVSQFVVYAVSKHLKYIAQEAVTERRIIHHQKIKDNCINELDIVIGGFCNSTTGCKFLNEQLESF